MIKHVVLTWIPYAITIVCVVGTMYALIQQDYRQSANDPQIQLAEDGAQVVGKTASPILAYQPIQIDIATSLAPYIVIYNKAGNPVAGNGYLHGELPSLPSGTFSHAQNAANGEDRFTWQPETGVRSAVVLIAFHGKAMSGYIMSGRSLREVEIRESSLLNDAVLAGVAALVLTFIGVWAGYVFLHREQGA